MRFTFTIEVEAERIEGKFAARDEIAAVIVEALEGADPGNISGDNGGEYEVSSWEVEEIPQPKRKAQKKKAAPAFEVVGRIADGESLLAERSYEVENGG